MSENDIYNKAIEDFAKRIITYYGHFDNVQGASVQYYVNQIKNDLLKEKHNEN